MATLKGRIEKVEIKEYTSGKVYSVSNGGSITVNEERIRITATVRNIGDGRGYIIVELLIDGVPKEQKFIYLSPYSSTSTYWDIEIPLGSHIATVRAGHMEGEIPI